MTEITLESIVKRNDSRVVCTELDDELIMMDLENGNYIRLNKTGRVIWEQLENPIQVEKLVSYLMGQFEVSQKDCTKSIVEFLSTMLRDKMLID